MSVKMVDETGTIGDLLVANDESAKVLAEDLAKTYPTNTMLKLYWLSTINAAIELDKGKPSQGLLDLETAAPYDLGQAGTFINIYVYLPAITSVGKLTCRCMMGPQQPGFRRYRTTEERF